MKGLDTGKDKVKKICDVLKKETLEPAKREAAEIIDTAKEEAAQLIASAHKEAERLLKEAGLEIEKQKGIFHAALSQACRQTLELLKQEIEERLFNRELSTALSKELHKEKVLAELIEAIVKAINKEGVDASLSAYISHAIDPRAVNTLIAGNILHQLKEKSVLISDMSGGVAVKLQEENMTIDISLATVKEIVARFVRKDFRELFFGAGVG